MNKPPRLPTQPQTKAFPSAAPQIATPLLSMKSDKSYRYVVHQNFIYKEKGALDSTAQVVPNSGFEIIYTLTKTDKGWVHWVLKSPRAVTIDEFSASEGRGTAFSNLQFLGKGAAKLGDDPQSRAEMMVKMMGPILGAPSTPAHKGPIIEGVD